MLYTTFLSPTLLGKDFNNSFSIMRTFKNKSHLNILIYSEYLLTDQQIRARKYRNLDRKWEKSCLKYQHAKYEIFQPEYLLLMGNI